VWVLGETPWGGGFIGEVLKKTLGWLVLVGVGTGQGWGIGSGNFTLGEAFENKKRYLPGGGGKPLTEKKKLGFGTTPRGERILWGGAKKKDSWDYME